LSGSIEPIVTAREQRNIAASSRKLDRGCPPDASTSSSYDNRFRHVEAHSAEPRFARLKDQRSAAKLVLHC
jgi:hypothetical protein